MTVNEEAIKLHDTEKIGASGDAEWRAHRSRFAVPGGWIYTATVAKGGILCLSEVFVPDPDADHCQPEPVPAFSETAHDRADAQGYARCTADVVAWVVEYRETCEFPDVRGIRDAIRTNAHVGAAGDE